MNICLISPKQREDVENMILFLRNIDKANVFFSHYFCFQDQINYFETCDVLVADVSQYNEYTFLLLGLYYGMHKGDSKIVLFTNNKRNLKLEKICKDFREHIARNYFELEKNIREVNINGKVI